jgi:hypothetical protein
VPTPDEAALIDGRYRIEGLLGEGGMGCVYAVVDELSGAKLALKRLSPGASPTVTALFQREYHTLVQLQHPCIVHALDYGVEPRGPYYTMERLGGLDLRKVAPLPWREGCGVLRDLASALALVHSRRLLHRDVNHKNVRYIEGERARLLDFGALSSFGVAAERVGMAAFMSPEAYHGQPLGPRSDLFALGGVAYWLLTGRLAYDALRSADLPALWRRTLPSPAQLGVALPSALDALVMQLLSLQALGRPGSAAEVMDRLAEIANLERGDPHQAARSYLANPRLVGRTRELERLDRVLRLGLRPPAPLQPSSARTGGFAPVNARSTNRVRRGAPQFGRGVSDSVLWVGGEHGMGRSRLLYELALQAKLQGARVAWVSAAALSGRPHSTLHALADALIGQEPELIELLDPARRALIDELLPRTGRRSEPPGATVMGFNGEHRPRLHAALVEWLMLVAEGRGLVVVVDDVQRVDEDSMAFLAALAASVDDGRVVLALASSGLNATASRALHVTHERATKLVLEGLDAVATQELITSVFGNATYSRRLAVWAHRVSAGNPLHCMQLVGHLVDAGLARYDHGGWTLPDDPEAHDLPVGLKDVYAARVAALSPMALELGRILALHDSPAPVERIARLASAPGGAELFGALAELTDAAIVDSDGKIYRVAHAPLAEALTVDLHDAPRAALHRRIAEALRAEHPRDLEERFEVAYHLLHGGADAAAMELIGELVRHTELVPAIGVRSCAVLERALVLCERDGRPLGDGVRIRLALVIGGTFYDPDLLRHVDAVLDQLRQASGVARAMQLDPTLPRGQRIRIGLREAFEAHAAAAGSGQLTPVEALVLLSTLILYLVHVYASRADVPAAARLLETTEALVGLGSLTDLVHENILAAVENMSGYDQRAHERFSRVIAGLDQAIAAAAPDADTAPLRRWRSTLFGVVASSALYSDPAESLRWADLADGAGAAIPAWRVRYLAGLMQIDHELIARAEERLDALTPPSLFGWEHGGWFLTHHGGILAMLGEAALLKEAVDRLQMVTGEHPGYAGWLGLHRGYLAVLRGERDAAERAFRDTLALDETRQSSPARQALVGLARLLTAAGRHAEALELCDAHAARMQTGEVWGIERNTYLAVRARALGGLGKRAEARALMDSALADAERYGALLHFDRLIDAGMLGLLLQEDVLVQRPGRQAGVIARNAAIPGLMLRYAVLEQLAQAAGHRLSNPPL